GVPYGRIMEDARAAIIANPARRQPRPWRMRAFMLRNVLARKGRLRAALALGRLYSRSGLQSLVRGPLRRVLPSRLTQLESSLPALNQRPYRRTGMLASPAGADTRVALLLGCIHGELY